MEVALKHFTNGNKIVIGVAGGSGSGKTTVAEMIAKDLGENRITLISQDNYYKDLVHLSPEERARVNFDHPESIDAKLMASHISQLKDGNSIEMPVYDFHTHTRHSETITVYPKEILLIEGILVLEREEIRNLMDIKIYVDTDDDIRLIRRLKRDITERGRDLDSVIDQYLNTVRPMHLEFVEKSKRCADIILPWRDFNTAAVSMVITMLRGCIELDHN
jgi:uridine kinase